ncbi:MAG: dihydropteroate synthase [Candidatus Gastranaerophilales bacterium]|nr:dihydropteroate synthase [Candidatus Gastranaerophilales bacterium]
MQKNINVKIANKNNIASELKSINYDKEYLEVGAKKFQNHTFKIFSLKPAEANILKQLCLSLGFDCAVSRDTITCKCETTDCVLNATKSQLDKLIKKLALQPFRLKELSIILKDKLTQTLTPIRLKRSRELSFSEPILMGILNVTPDSFSDGGCYNSPQKALEHALKLIKNGAQIIDIGGESTKPGAMEITQEEETKRVIPAIKAIRTIDKDIIISVDTRNFETAKASIEAGADIVNDVSALEHDLNLKDYVCQNNIPTIIMHSNKVPAQSSIKTENATVDIVEEIYFDLNKKVNDLIEKGLDKSNIIIDPGIGFGKSIDDSYEIIKRINEFSSIGCPILMGISRKSFISKKFNISNEELDEATIAIDMFLFSQGANIIRAHEIAKHKNCLNVLKMVF